MIKLVFVITFFSVNVFSQFRVDKVNVTCKKEVKCSAPKALRKIEGGHYTKVYLDNLLKLISRQNGIEEISYRVKDNQANFIIKKNPIINKLSIEFENKVYAEALILPAVSGDFFTKDLNKKNIDYLNTYFSNLGYTGVKVNFNMNHSNAGVDLTYKIKYSNIATIKEIRVNTSEALLRKKIGTFFSGYINESYKRIEFSSAVEDLKQVLFDAGYYFLEIDSKVNTNNTKITIDLHIKNTERQAFRTRGVSSMISQRIIRELKNTARIYKRILSDISVKEIVSNKLRGEGFYGAVFEVKTTDLLDEDNLIQTIVTIQKSKRTKISEISFRGNSFFSEEELRAYFFANASESVSYDFPDISYYKSFTNLLKRKYVENGFASVQIREPSLKFLSTNTGRVIFKVLEGQRTKVSDIKIPNHVGIRSNTLKKIKSLKNKYFNPIEFSQMINELSEEMFKLGYYYFKINNLNSSNFVSYSKDNASVIINMDLFYGEKIRFRAVKYFGNKKTKDKLLKKYLNIQENEIITRKKIREYQSQLLSLGIFKSLKISPLHVSDGVVDLIVQLKESEFGLIELAPGIRSDLGPKFSGTISYTNLGGMNRVASLKVQVNKRFDLSSINEERKEGDEDLVEYETELSFSENKIFSTNLNFFTSISALRNRFYSTDADIQKINYTFSTKFTKWFRASFTQQLESVSQFNSVDEVEEGMYEIGSITPSVTFDFRNNRVNPTKGAYFNLSFERASPSLKSQNDEELKVDYYKLVARNYFYIPFKNGTFAISVAGGVQENLAKNRFDASGEATGYIPNVKVFRLSGTDLVRGYDDSEINTLVDGNDISQRVITDKAYMINLKLEPRFFLSDNFIAGVFFDAGRVFVDEFESNQLRSSYGITFKYLTPVGTLDFDYGIKTLRKKDSSGKLESPGRLHVSIGFF